MAITRADLKNAYRLAEILKEKAATQAIVGTNVQVTIRMDTALVKDLAGSIRALAELAVDASDAAKADAQALSTATIKAVLLDESFAKVLRLAVMLRLVRFCSRVLERRKAMKTNGSNRVVTAIGLAFVGGYCALMFGLGVWRILHAFF